MKRLDAIKNPNQKRVNFKCNSCSKVWIRPVNYYIKTRHPAAESLVDYYEYEICKKCAIKEVGNKNKKRKEFFDE